jgi:hypothetical protein
VKTRLANALRRWRGPPIPDPAADEIVGLDPADLAIIEQARPHSMTSVARLAALIDAVRYCVGRDVPGAFAECGVWRGGSILAMILTLQELGVQDREIYLYDTFEGMTRPTARDTSQFEDSAFERWDEEAGAVRAQWRQAFAPDVLNEEVVRQVVLASGYPAERLHFIAGPVEQTLPQRAPARLALLRLDTDWYESTRHELVHLYPRLEIGGVLILDDYGHWDGCRRAVDEYFSSEAPPVLLSRIDYTGRIAIKH